MKFRRKSTEPDVADEALLGEQADPAAPVEGPFDVDELPDDGVERLDLGSLLIEPEPGRELRLQVDESTGEVQSVILAEIGRAHV